MQVVPLSFHRNATASSLNTRTPASSNSRMMLTNSTTTAGLAKLKST